MLRIKKNDKVVVIAGKDKGKTGRVLEIFIEAQRARVEGINMMKKARRRTKQEEKGGLIEMESPIHLSNLMLADKKSNKPTRFGVSILKDGSKVRISKLSKEAV